jgi:hypothetical protein
LAKELVTLQPDVIVCNASPTTGALQRETRTIPIVFTGVADPIGSGFVASLAKPGANITGFLLGKHYWEMAGNAKRHGAGFGACHSRDQS